MDRNTSIDNLTQGVFVALRKESVDRNFLLFPLVAGSLVALRKESVDRNSRSVMRWFATLIVALRKESVDRNNAVQIVIIKMNPSLSARRAWIEISL